MKHCYWEHRMLPSWYSNAIPNETLLLGAQYAFIMTLCYAQWSSITRNIIGEHESDFMTQYCNALIWTFSGRHSLLYNDTVLLCQIKHSYWEYSMLSSRYSNVVPKWNIVTGSTICFNHDTVVLCPMKPFYWEHNWLPTWVGLYDTVLLCPMKQYY